MQTLFAPAIALMNRLKYPGKFALMGVFAVLAVAVLLASLAVNLYQTIRLTRNEQAATAVILPLQKQIQLTQQHRGLSAGFLGGNTAMKEKLEAKQADVIAAIRAVDDAEAHHAAVLATTPEWNAIKADWNKLREALYGMKVPETLTAHGQLIERILRFQNAIADAGALNGDPDIDSFYLIDTLTTKLPDMLERLGKMRAKGTGVLAKKELSETDKIEFSVHVAVLKRTLDALRLNLDKAGKRNPSIALKLDKFSQELAAATEQVVRMVNDDILSARFEIAPQTYFDRCTQTIDIGYRELFETLLPTLNTLLDARIARLQGQFALQIGLAAFFLAILGFLSMGTYYAVMNAIRALSTGAQSIAGGDLRARIALDCKDELGAVGSNFNAMAVAFDDLLRQVHRTVDSLSASSANLATSAGQVASSSHEQSEAAYGMAAAIQQMSASIDQISGHANSAENTSTAAGKLAQEGTAIVDKTVNEMEQISGAVNQSAGIIEELGKHSDGISAIINVIKEIADQTNLLALNAAIEAARAGEQGRGFAVVADEVRKLAERTTQATQEIGGMIGAIQSGTGNAVQSMQDGVARVNDGVALSRQAGEAISRIRERFDDAMREIGEITLALKEQSVASNEAAHGVERIAAMADQNSAAVQLTTDTAKQLETLANELQQQIRHFKV